MIPDIFVNHTYVRQGDCLIETIAGVICKRLDLFVKSHRPLEGSLEQVDLTKRIQHLYTQIVAQLNLIEKLRQHCFTMRIIVRANSHISFIEHDLMKMARLLRLRSSNRRDMGGQGG